MLITEFHSLSGTQLADMLVLMGELDPSIPVTAEMLAAAVESPGSHLFAAVDAAGHISACGTLCVYDSPTGKKASIEDVVVLTSARGQHLGRRLLEYIIHYACEELGDVDLHLTSRPERTAANNLYKSLGFRLRHTNAYVMKIRGSEAPAQ